MTDQCPICLENLVDNIGVAVPCGHCFHRNCFDRLKTNAEQRTDDILERALLQRCCICKKKVRKFHNIFLSFDATGGKAVPSSSEQQLQATNEQLVNQLEELQVLSSDQSEILCRLVPRHDHLEARYAQVKKERHGLKRQLDAMEDHNWDLRFNCFDAEAKLERTKAHRSSVELQLEEAVGENHDLHEIWDSLEEQLETTRRKRKVCKTKLMQKLRETCQQLDSTQEEVHKANQEKELLQGKLSRFRLQVSKLKEMRKSAKRKQRTKSKHRMPKVDMIA